MSDENAPQEGQETDADRNWKELRETKERYETRAKELEAEVKGFKLKEAFSEAGFDPSDKRTAVAMKAYDGDLDATKVREWGFENEFLVEAASPSAPQVDAASQITNAHSGAQPPGGMDTGAMNAEIAQAQNPDEVVQILQKYGRPISYQ